MAVAFRKLGDVLVRRADHPASVDPQGVALYQSFGTYIKTLPDRWALFPGDLKAFRANIGEYRVGDVTYEGGTFFAQLIVLGYVGYCVGLGNRTPWSYHLTGWKTMADRVTGGPVNSPPQPYDTPYKP